MEDQGKSPLEYSGVAQCSAVQATETVDAVERPARRSVAYHQAVRFISPTFFHAGHEVVCRYFKAESLELDFCSAGSLAG